MKKEKAQFGKLWITLIFIAVLFAFAAASLSDYLLYQEATDAGLLSPFEFTDLYHQLLLYASPLCLAGFIGFIVGMASKERSIQMISSFSSLLGASIPFFARLLLVLKIVDLPGYDMGSAPEWGTYLLLGALLLGFVFFLIATLVRFKKGNGTLVYRILGAVFLLGVAVLLVLPIIRSGAPIADVLLNLSGISMMLKAAFLVFFAVGLLALRSVKEKAMDLEEPTSVNQPEDALSGQEEPAEAPAEQGEAEEVPQEQEEEEDLPVGQEEFFREEFAPDTPKHVKE